MNQNKYDNGSELTAQTKFADNAMKLPKQMQWRNEMSHNKSRFYQIMLNNDRDPQEIPKSTLIQKDT